MPDAGRKRVALLNDTSAWYHWGCTGTSSAIKEEITRRGYEVLAVPIHQIYECRHVPETPADFDNPQFFNQFFHENITVTGPILKSDIVVINGEGSIHGVSQIALVLLYLAYASKRYCQKQVQIINHSCFPDSSVIVDNSPASAVYRGVYRLMDFVAVREHLSQKLLETLGVNATLAFDCLPLYIESHPVTARRTDSRSIVLAGSVAWRASGLSALAAFIKDMAAEGYAIKVLTGARDRPAEDDKSFVKALKQASPAGWSHVEAHSMDEWLGAIASSSLLVSGRFHYTIASCALQTPCVVLGSNTPKNSALCEAAHLSPPLAYDTHDLHAALVKASRDVVNVVPSTGLAKEWCGRAWRNFNGLPDLTVNRTFPAPRMIRAYSGDSKGATAFFRNRALLDTVTKLLRGKTPRVLFHAASVGAEPYSFAVWCRLHGNDCAAIDATDLSDEFLGLARKAAFDRGLLESMTDEERGFFDVSGDVMQPKPEIREAVSFIPACSFVTAEFGEPYDVVFVTNALTYVTPDKQAEAIDRIAQYNTALMILTAFHPATIKDDLTRNGYEPVADDLEAIHNGWGDRISPNAPEGHSWMLPPFTRIDDYEYRYCAIFRKRTL